MSHRLQPCIDAYELNVNEGWYYLVLQADVRIPDPCQTKNSLVKMTQSSRRGTEKTRHFYDEVGWRVQGGKPVDFNLFGVKEDGPIRIELHRLHMDRIRLSLSRAGTALNILECGCGGNPERQILEMCSRYTGVDFSERGLQLARSSFSDVRIPHEFQKADVCALPFNDGAFDAVYCANMIYHIDDAASQDAALAEMARVVRPGGVVVLIAVNPYPLAFPVRLVRGLARDTPVVGFVLNRIRSMSIGVGLGPQIGIQKGPLRFPSRTTSARPVGAGRGCGDGASAG